MGEETERKATDGKSSQSWVVPPIQPWIHEITSFWKNNFFPKLF